MKFIGLLSILFYSNISFGMQLKADDIEALKSKFGIEDTNLVLGKSSAQLKGYLDSLDKSQAIWLTSEWLKKLSQLNQPNPEQRAWVEEQLASQQKLTMASQEHPEKSLSLINIAQQAKATKFHWQLSQQVESIHSDWQNGRLSWRELLSGPNNQLKQKALIQWLVSLAENEVSLAADRYLRAVESLPEHNNALVAVLAEKSKSTELYKVLWQRPVDEFSYQALAKLHLALSEAQAIEQTLATVQNQQLQSQSMLILAKHYSHDSQAQNALLQALDDPKGKWHALAALVKVKDPAFLDRLKLKFNQHKPSKFSQLALRKLSSGLTSEDL